MLDTLEAVRDEVAIAPGYVVKVYSHPDQVSTDWPRGGADTAARCHAFQTVTFIETWQATYGEAHSAQLCLIEVRDRAGRPVLMLPLQITSLEGGRVLGFTDFGVSDYNAPVLFPTGVNWTRQSARDLWEAIVAQLPAFDLAKLDKMPAQVGGLDNPLFLLATEDNAESCHLTRLDRPWSEVEKVIQGAKKLRQNHRGLQRLGSCDFVVAETAEQRRSIVTALLEQKQRRFEETHVPGFDAHPEKRDFFTLGTERFAAAGALHLSALVANGHVISAMWALTHGRHYYGLFITNETGEWMKYSPGRVLHYQLLEHLSQRGFDCLDLGIGDEPWKLASCDTTVPLRQLVVASTWRGKMIVQRRMLRKRISATKVWQTLRPLKWVVLRALRRRTA